MLISLLIGSLYLFAMVYAPVAVALSPSTVPNWTGESNQAGASFGESVADAGDVNGDGYADTVVGAPNFPNPGAAPAPSYAHPSWGEGQAYLYLGTSAGPAVSPAWTILGDQDGGTFGHVVAGAGDVNNDGHADVVVAAHGYDNALADEGRIYLYLGSASGLSTAPAWQAEGDRNWAYFGHSLAGAGDVNNDGYDDVVIGAVNYNNGQVDEGAVFLYYGTASGLQAAPAWSAESNQASASFGFSVAGADVNGDGYSDIIVGSTRYDNGEVDEGRAFVYLGSASGPAATPVWTAESNQTGAEFGQSVVAGDTDNDGYHDVIVGARSYDNGEVDEGRVYLYLGSASGPATTAAWTGESNQPGAQFGHTVFVKDINQDNYADVLVGARAYDGGEVDEGRAYLYLGSPGSLDTASWTAEGNQGSAEFGFSVSAGDTDGNGFPDIIVGAPSYDSGQTDEGRAFVYSSERYYFITKWGDSGLGQLVGPYDLARDAAGNLYVSDTNDESVKKFDSSGNFITKWGSFGTGNGQFSKPHGIIVDSAGNVNVVDHWNNRVQKFDSSGNYLTQWGSSGSGDGQFNHPVGIAIDNAGNFYITDHNNHRVQKFDSSGNFITKWGSFGSGDGQFNEPKEIAIDSLGDVYVTDGRNHRVQKFDSSGNFITKWGSFGTGNGQFDFPHGIEVDGSNNVYVADSNNSRVQKFDSSGNFITKWGSFGTGNGQFNFPEGIEIDSVGDVYVAERDNPRVQKFSLNPPQDTASPVTTLETSPTTFNGLNGWFKTTPIITLTRNEPGSTYYRWDSQPTTQSYSTAFAAPEGQHTLYYYSVDTAGNTETVKSQLFKVDTGIPTDPAATSSSHTVGQLSNDNTIDVNWSGATDSVSGVDGFSIEWSSLASTVPDAVKDIEESVSSATSAPLADGNWYFHLRTKDNSGNWTSTVHLGPFGIDTAAPTTAPEASPATPNGQNGWYTTTPTVSLARNEPGTTYYRWDNQPTTQSYSTAFSGLEGQHTLYYYSVDTAGNTETVQSQPMKVDTAAPADPNVSSPSHTVGQSSTDNTIDIALTNASDATSGVDGFSIEWSPLSFTLPDSVKDLEETATTASSPALAIGTWYFHLRTVDNAGNWTSTVHLGPFLIVSAGDLVLNPGFETGDFSNWNNSPKWTVTSTDSHSGTYSALYQPGGTGMFREGGSLGQAGMPVVGGKWYTISAWIKQMGTETEFSSLFGGARFGADLDFSDSTGRGFPVLPELFSNEAGSWVYRERVFYAPLDASVTVRFGLHGRALDPDAKILVDDVRLVENSTPPNTVAPGAIETWPLNSTNFVSPEEMVSDGQGYLWIGTWEEQPAQGGLIKWNPRTNSEAAHYPLVGSQLDASTLFVSSVGEIWWASWCGDKVGAFDPVSATSSETTLATWTSGRPCGQVRPVSPVEASDGSFWFSENETAKITRWDRSTGTTQGYSFSDPNARLAYLIKDKNGKFWFPDRAGERIGSFDPVTRTYGALYQVGAPDSMPNEMKIDEQGKIWYSLWRGNKIGKLDPDTGVTAAYSIPTPSAGPHNLAIDRLGNVWFAESWAGAIGKLDPATGQIAEYRKKEFEQTKWVWVDDKGNLYYGSVMPRNLKGGFLNRIKNTQPGSSVEVGLFDLNPAKDKILATFDSITAPGDTDASAVAPPAPAPAGLTLIGQTWDLNTTASRSGGVDIGLSYDESQVGAEAALRLLHWTGFAWEDITTSVDTVKNTVWGRTLSLSPVVVAQDSTPPTTPTLSGWVPSGSQVNLSWSTSSSNIGVAGYKIFNADTGALLASTGITSHTFGGLTPGTVYGYYVKAYDAAGNLSGPSNTVRIDPGAGTSTEAGSTVAPVTAVPTSFASVTFSDITSDGQTTVTVTSPPEPLPSGFQFVGQHYEITTSASFVPPILVSLKYDDTGMSPEAEAALRMFHHENGDWVDVTVLPVDTANNVVTGQVDSLSPVALGGPSLPSTGTDSLPKGFLGFLAALLGLALLAAGSLKVRRYSSEG